MKATKKNLSTTQIELTVTLDKSDLETARLKAVSSLASEVKVAGFRKGKVPANVAEKHIDPNDLSSATLDIAIRSSLPKAYESVDVNPISLPEVSVDKYVPGEMIEYRSVSDVFPEVKLGNYKNLKAKNTFKKPTAKDVDEILNNIAKSYAEKKVVNRPAKLDDEVQIDFTGKLDGVAFDGGSAKDHKITLGSGQFIPGFEDGIVGHSVGDKFELELTFPKDYHSDKLAGKKTVFEVLLKQINESSIPKIDDELAKKAGPFKTIADLKKDIEKNLTEQSRYKAGEKFKDDLVAELVQSSKVDAPATLVADNLNFIKNDLDANLKSHKLDREAYFKQIGKNEEEWTEEAKKIAEERVRSALVLQALATTLKLSATDVEVENKIAELREAYKKNEEALKNLSDPRVAADIKNRLTLEKSIDALVKANS